MPLLSDRVLESTTTTGTGTFSLGGALTGYRAFNSAFSNGNVVYYTADNGQGEWEVGYGTIGTGTLSRDVVLESSNANALVAFSAGTKRLFCTAPASAITNASLLGTGVATFLATPSSANLAAAVTDETGSGALVFATSPTLVTPALGTPSSGTLTSCTGLPLSTGVTGTLPVANGGTGTTSLTANNVLLGNGTSALQVVAPGTAGNVLTSNGSTWTSAAAGASLYGQTNSGSPFETSLGYLAGSVNTGISNIFIGVQAGQNNTTGTYNVAVGTQAFLQNTTGSFNIAVGTQALYANTIGAYNTAVGTQALYSNTTGANNTAVGYAALYYNTTGSYNTAVGWGALSLNSTGANNTAQGYGALNANTTGTNNTAQGYQALLSSTTGAYNTAVGTQALYSNTTGANNTAVGYVALYYNTTGTNNTAQGYQALYSNTTGAQNTAIGYQAGYGGNPVVANTTGTNNTFLGYRAVGASATASNVITLGNSSIATLRCQVTTITALSDARDKTDIAELDAGLDFINALAPVSFTWNMRDGGKVDEPDTGFIAQELVKAQEDTGHYIPGLVYDENPERLEAGYGKLIPVLVKAIQELSAEVSILKSQLNGSNND